MKQEKGDYRGFTNCGEAYYHKTLGFFNGVTGEVFLGLCAAGGGTKGEMKMEWVELGGKNVPQLQVFDDGWEVLASWPDLLAELAKVDCGSMSEKSITPKEFCEILLRLGFTDNTIRENPNPPDQPKPTNEEMEAALKSIAALWPDPDCAAELVPEWVGPNDGRLRADTLFYALNTARKAINLPTYPEPEHWSKKKVEREEEEL